MYEAVMRSIIGRKETAPKYPDLSGLTNPDHQHTTAPTYNPQYSPQPQHMSTTTTTTGRSTTKRPQREAGSTHGARPAVDISTTTSAQQRARKTAAVSTTAAPRKTAAPAREAATRTTNKATAAPAPRVARQVARQVAHSARWRRDTKEGERASSQHGARIAAASGPEPLPTLATTPTGSGREPEPFKPLPLRITNFYPADIS